MHFYFVCILTWKWWKQKLSNHNKRMSISCICHVYLLSLHNNMEMVKTEADPASNMWAMSAVTLVLTPLPHSFSLPHMKYKATIHSLQFVGKDQCHLLSRAQREHKPKLLSSLLHLLCVLRHSKSEYFSKQNRGRYPQSRTEKTAAHNFLSTKKDNRTNSSFWEMPSIQKPFFYGSLWLSFSENFILANEGKNTYRGL